MRSGILSAITIVLTYGAPLMLLLWTRVGTRQCAPRQLVAAGSVLALLTGLATTLAWYVKPDYAGSPKAALVAAAVLQLPALCGMVLSFVSLSKLAPAPRMAVSTAIAYGIMALSIIPALVAFVSLGGDTL